MNLSKQEFLNMGDSAKYIQDKRKLRAELEAEMAKFLANGGVVRSAPTGQSGVAAGGSSFRVNHGTNTKYVKQSCRCDVCVNWAFKKGLIKTKNLRVKS